MTTHKEEEEEEEQSLKTLMGYRVIATSFS